MDTSVFCENAARTNQHPTTGGMLAKSFHSNAQLRPNAQPDWDAIERAVFGRSQVDDAPSVATEPAPAIYTRDDLTRALGDLGRWIVLGSASSIGTTTAMLRINADAVAHRALAATWMTRPDLFEGRSLAAVGMLPKVNASRRALHHHAAEFEAAFGIRSNANRTQTNRDQLSTAARNRWKRKVSAVTSPNAGNEAGRPAFALPAGDPTAR